MQAMQGQQRLRIKIPKLQRKFQFHFPIKDDNNNNDSDNSIRRDERGNDQLPRKIVGVGSALKVGKCEYCPSKEKPHEQNRKVKKPVKIMNLGPLLNFLDHKKNEWNFNIKAKTRTPNTTRFSSHMRAYGDGSNKATKYGNGNDVVIASFGLVTRRKVSSWRLVRIPSKILVVRLKLKTMMRSLMIKKKVMTKQSEQDLEQEGGDENVEEDKEDGRELCKKRILMGGRCKPMSSSGTLRYDKDGIFLPEILP